MERRRVASMVEMTSGGDISRINEIVARYEGPEMQKVGMSEGNKSLMSQVKSSQESKNLLNTFNNEIND